MSRPAPHLLLRPRKLPHVAPILDYLGELGAKDVYVTQKGHLHLHWTPQDRPMRATMASSPSETTLAVKITKSLIRRTCRHHGVAVAA